jgi:tetratricopeptide (TPR) repeat protein
MRRHTTTFALCAFLALACCAHHAFADAVVLNNGTRIEGDVKRTDTGWTVTSTDGKVTEVSADDVKTIEVGGPRPSDAAVSASNLASLRRSVAVITSPAVVLERYRRFLDQNKGTPSIEDARRDMAIWQQRLDGGLVKVGGQWVTPQQKGQMASQANSIAKQAVDLLTQGRTTEAEPVIQQALDADPQNPAALYLRGEMLFGENQLVAARKSFEAVVASIAGHAPSENNLAVILWKQNQQMGAMRFYELSMIASPVNKIVLDNVAEALQALPIDERTNPLAVRVQKLFTDQDAQLQEIMAQSGYHRWGSTWVDQATLDRLKAAEKSVKDQLAQLEEQVAAAKAKITDDDSNIDTNNRAMSQMQDETYMRDPTGKVFQAPLPASYYTMQSDNEKFAADRAQQEATIQAIIQQGQKIQQSLPVPQYTGIQRLIGVEGTPFPMTPPATAPATSPTTAPAAPLAAPGGSAPVLMPLP